METFDTPNPITVSLGLSYVVANVRITATDRADTTVDVRPADPNSKADQRVLEQARVEYADGRLTVRTPKLANLFAKTGAIDVTVALPTGSGLDGDIGMGEVVTVGHLADVHVKNGFGEVRLDEAATVTVKSGAGDISVERAVTADVTTGSGEVRLRQVAGPATVKNSNGGSWIGEAAGEVRVKGANGSVTVERALGDVTATTANGSIRLGEVVRGEVSLQTAAGALEVGVRAGTSAWLDLSTVAGRVTNGLDDASAPTEGQATVRIHARTHVGNVVIRRAAGDRA